AIGCIQAQRCHTGRCPTGVTTQDPYRQRGLVVEDKSVRVARYQQGTVAEAVKLMAAMGVSDPSELRPWMLRRNLSQTANASYAELYEWLGPDQLLTDPPEDWAAGPAPATRTAPRRSGWGRTSCSPTRRRTGPPPGPPPRRTRSAPTADGPAE